MMVSFRFPVSLILISAFLIAVKAGMYSEHVVELTASNFDALVIDSTETWLVKFYAPWCGHCQSSAPAFSKAAKKLRGVARLGAVNCDDHQDIAHRFGVQGFPTIKVFKGEGRQARRPSEYNSARSSQAFVDHVKYVMPSYVARVKPTGALAFFADLPKLPHVLLFTEQSSTSPLYKGMSARFKNRLSFGEVRKMDAAHLLSDYAVTSFPTLLGFHPGKSDSESAVRYAGMMDPESLDKFFNEFSNGTSSEGTTSSTDERRNDQPNSVFTQPKAYSGEVVSVVGTRAYDDLCGSRRDGRMCALAFIPGGRSSQTHEMLKPVAQKYLYDNLAFASMDGDIPEVKQFAKIFGVPSSGGFVVIRARKNKIAVLESDEMSKDIVMSFLDKVVGGDARWKKISEILPDWKAEGDEEAEDPSTDNVDAEGRCGREPEDGGGSCHENNENI